MAESFGRDDRAAATPSAGKDGRRLIVGAASRYRPEQIRPFVESLRATGYAGDVVILVNFWNWRLQSYLRRFAMTPYRIWTTRRIHGPAATHRYEFYARLARQNRDRYDEMMVTDTRDVLFQRNPFADLKSSACHYYLEHATRTIGEEPTNLSWAKLFLPAEQAAAVSRHRVSCCGIVIGGMAAMDAYLARMAADLRAVPLRDRRRGGADTTLHQGLVFLDGGAPGVVMENNIHVATMGIEPDSTYRIGDDGLVRTADGHVPAILHQYDRVPHISPVIAKRYGGLA
ncbi:MAG TPA: hypothetical protein VGG01_13275 [Xanthobacteraceae bacterium]